MQCWSKRVGLALVALAVGFLTGLPAGIAAPNDTKEKKPAPKKKAKKPSKATDLARKLREPVTLEHGLAPKTPLKDALEFLSQHHDITILVDTAAFKEEKSEEWDGVVETAPVQLAKMKDVALGTVLRMVVAQLPPKGTGYLVRNGFIEITTARRAAPACLLRQKVAAAFDGRPLEDALQELSDRSAVSVIVDGRVGHKAKTPVTATFKNDVSVGTAVRLLADMADLKAVRLGEGLYVTTKDNAKVLEAEEEKSNLKKVKPKSKDPVKPKEVKPKPKGKGGVKLPAEKPKQK
jgi:hypothetical protein